MENSRRILIRSVIVLVFAVIGLWLVLEHMRSQAATEARAWVNTNNGGAQLTKAYIDRTWGDVVLKTEKEALTFSPYHEDAWKLRRMVEQKMLGPGTMVHFEVSKTAKWDSVHLENYLSFLGVETMSAAKGKYRLVALKRDDWGHYCLKSIREGYSEVEPLHGEPKQLFVSGYPEFPSAYALNTLGELIGFETSPRKWGTVVNRGKPYKAVSYHSGLLIGQRDKLVMFTRGFALSVTLPKGTASWHVKGDELYAKLQNRKEVRVNDDAYHRIWSEFEGYFPSG